MKASEYAAIESYMQSCMKDSAHDRAHVQRVLMGALAIAREEGLVDDDILIAACLLHDIGRPEQMANPGLCHAQVGAEKAHAFLLSIGWQEERAAHVRDCIRSHRFRKSAPPESIEAKILYDADKLDVTGAIGVARTLIYNGAMDEPIYSTGPDGSVLDGACAGEGDSFFHEYRFKLEKVYGRFLTATGAHLAAERQAAARSFYESLLNEVQCAMDAGRTLLENIVE